MIRLLLVLPFVVVTYVEGTGVTCQPGKTVSGECLFCKCGVDGQYYCQVQGCVLPPYSRSSITKNRRLELLKLVSSCKVGETFFDGCNVCGCQPGVGYVICTKRACSIDGGPESLDPVKPVSQAPKPSYVKVCIPYRTWFDGCNWCSCTTDGRSKACTKKYCETPFYKRNSGR